MQEIAKALTWTFIHSLWLGLLAALLAAIIISITRKAVARLRYNLLCIVMILFLGGSFVTFFIQAEGTQATPVAASSLSSGEVTEIDSTGDLMHDFTAWVNANSNMIMVGWMFFFLFCCVRLITGLAAVGRLRHYKTHPVTEDWKTKLEQLQLMIGVRYPVLFLQSELVKVPMALGILKPVIMVPIGLITHLPAEQVETILLHELAHIRRKDYLVNLLQHIVEAIFFFNPAIRWISSLMRQEREASCDDMVIASCDQKTNYLNALINFQEYSFKYSSYAMGIGGKRHYLLNRVKRMITNRNKGLNFFETIALLISAISFSASTYLMKETDAKKGPAKSDSYQLRQPEATVLPIVLSQPQNEPVKREKVNLFNKPLRDTIPAKKKVATNSKSIDAKKPVTKLKDAEQTRKDADATLQEIIQMKNEIGLKKESIGANKEKLKTAIGPEKDKILKEIERQRDELDQKRKVLDIKRELWDDLKEKAKEKQFEERNSDVRKVISHEKSSTIKKNDTKHWDKKVEPDKSDQWDKSIEPDKSDQWDKSVEPDKSDQWDVGKKKERVGRKNTVSADPRKKNLEVDKNKWNKQEHQYKMSLPPKDPPPAKPAPDNLKTPGAPVKKVQPVKPATGN